jgi:hypothetical protein
MAACQETHKVAMNPAMMPMVAATRQRPPTLSTLHHFRPSLGLTRGKRNGQAAKPRSDGGTGAAVGHGKKGCPFCCATHKILCWC